MKTSFAISLSCHAALIAGALLVLPAPAPFEVKPQEAIQVDISAVITDKNQKQAKSTDPSPPDAPLGNKVTKVVQDTPPAQKVADEIKTAAREPKAPPPEPKAKPEPPKPQPDLKALDQLLVADAAAQKKIDDAKKKADEKKKADDLKKADDKKKADQKKKLDATLAESQALLNKIAGESTAPAKPSDKIGAPKAADKNTQGADQVDTATLAAALVAKVRECFTIPPAAREANISVPVSFSLNPDGTVRGRPEIMNGSTDPIFQATARAAVSAIMECQAYDLPQDQYDSWKDNELDFNPTQLLR